MNVIYNTIGTGYNSTRKADLYITSRLLYFLEPEHDDQYLDVGCGTGNYTIALSDAGLNFAGVEPSEKMLGVARKRSQKVNWLAGSAEQIPVNDNSFNGLIATLTIHHWEDLELAFRELYRVIRSGKVVIFTALPEQMKGYWLNHYFPGMMQSSIVQMPSHEKINNALKSAGFNYVKEEKYFIQDDLQDCFLYAGKNKPGLYLDEEIRNGISSFTALANAEEVKKGLLKLRTDIENGEFTNIKRAFNNDSGDYLFIIAEKK